MFISEAHKLCQNRSKSSCPPRRNIPMIHQQSESQPPRLRGRLIDSIRITTLSAGEMAIPWASLVPPGYVT